MHLSEPQKRLLRGLGHKLKPVITVGAAGLSESLLSEFDAAIRHHELIKVRFRVTDREQRNAMVDELCSRGSASLVSRTGHTALLYRKNRDKTKISLS